MKKLQLLKTLVELFWFFSIIAMIGMVILIPIMLFSSEPIDIPMKVNGEEISINDLSSKFMTVIVVIAFALFAYGIYLLRTLLNLFSNRIIFEEASILLLDKIGKCFLISSLLTGIIAFIYNLIIRKVPNISFGGGFDSFLFSASLGLFFMVLSEVFKIAKTMKEENDLTL